MQIETWFASESHVPRFRAGVGTWRSGYMIQIRLPWRLRARPSATLHEIQVYPEGQTCLHNATQPSRVRQSIIRKRKPWVLSAVLIPFLVGVPLQAKLDQPVDQVRIGQSRRRP